MYLYFISQNIFSLKVEKLLYVIGIHSLDELITDIVREFT